LKLVVELPIPHGKIPEESSVMSAQHRRASPEAQIQRAVCDHLHLRAKAEVLWLHVPNGERRDPRIGAKLKRMGVLAGASDILAWHQGNSFALELKSPGSRPSAAQLEFLARFNEAGGHTCIAEGLDRALAVLEQWGLLWGSGMSIRRRLPNRRLAETFELECAGLRYTATVGRYQDGTVGELFLNNHKSNSASDANARDSAIVASLAIQHGVPIETIRRALLRDSQGRPNTPLGTALDIITGG
jgi:hypothetical protein